MKKLKIPQRRRGTRGVAMGDSESAEEKRREQDFFGKC
jgi:hypothetical protein